MMTWGTNVCQKSKRKELGQFCVSPGGAVTERRDLSSWYLYVFLLHFGLSITEIKLTDRLNPTLREWQQGILL